MREEVGRKGGWNLLGKGLRRKEGGGLRERGKWSGEAEEEVKGGAGMPVNSWTMARKLEVSVVRTVVGARRDARERFLEGLPVGPGAAVDGLVVVVAGGG